MAKLIPPTSEELLDLTVIPDELHSLEGFQDCWSEWVCYKQEECCDRDQNLKPWNSIKAGQRALSMIRNQHLQGRNVIHVINESMLNQWVGIRFDLVPDPVKAPAPKTRDQVSALDQAWVDVNRRGIPQ